MEDRGELDSLNRDEDSRLWELVTLYVWSSLGLFVHTTGAERLWLEVLKIDKKHTILNIITSKL